MPDLASTTFKCVELLECWKCYRYWYTTKKIRSKIQLNRIIFVDDCLDNLREIGLHFDGVSLFASVSELMIGINSITKAPNVSIAAAKARIIAAHHTIEYFIPQTAYAKRVDGFRTVFINALAKCKNHNGSTNMRFHLHNNCSALLRCAEVAENTQSECLEYGHSLCKICAYA